MSVSRTDKNLNLDQYTVPYEQRDPRVDPKYPIYIPTKGRYQPNRSLTVNTLRRDGCPFRLVVEEPEYKQYCDLVGKDKVLVLPWTNHGEGVTAARNWCRFHAEAEGHARHWQLDDNIMRFRRIWKGLRVPMRAGLALKVCEEMSDRYSNIGVSGLNYQMFVPPDVQHAYYTNVHVYSCTLTNHEMPYLWRLDGWNEDTDICLQALANGWSTFLINTVMCDKLRTMKLGGGNTEEHYADRDDEQTQKEGNKGEGINTDTLGRYRMAQVLADTWPGVVTVRRKFGRWQHSVNWGLFRDKPLPIPIDPAVPAEGPVVDELGMVLRKVVEPESELVQDMFNSWDETLPLCEPQGEWKGLPGFMPQPRAPGIMLTLPDLETRDKLIEELGVTAVKRNVQASSAWWPPRRRNDLSALIFCGPDEADLGEIIPRIHPHGEGVEMPVPKQKRSASRVQKQPVQQTFTPREPTEPDHDFKSGPLRRDR